MTSRRATRRARALERRVLNLSPASVAAVDEVATIAALTREAEQVGRELAGLLDSDAGRGLVGWGRVQRLHVRRATVPPELEARPPAVPGGCYEAAMLYLLRHRDVDLVLVHGLIVEADLPLAHAFVALPGAVIFDPSTGDFYQAASYAEVLRATAVCAHDPADALTRAAAGQGPGPWDDCLDAHTRVLDAFMDRFDAANPELVAWFNQMLSHDAELRARYRRAAGRNILAAVHTLLDLSRHQRWRQHEPGERWPHGWPHLETLSG